MNVDKKKELSDIVYGHNPNIQEVFDKHKNLFELRESFKIKGKLFEFFSAWTENSCFYFILKENKVIFKTYSSIYAPAIDTWRKLTGSYLDIYLDGNPYYMFKDASDVEIIYTKDKYLQFHKIYKHRTSLGIKEQSIDIPNTPFRIFRSVVWDGKDKNTAEYSKDYKIAHTKKWNIENGYKINANVISAFAFGCEKPTIEGVLQTFVKSLEKTLARIDKGYWDFAQGIKYATWIEEKPEKIKELQQYIEMVKLFKP